MSGKTLYAYVDGSDLAEVEDRLLRAFEEFVASRRWVCKGACVINQQHPPDDSVGPGDLPDWDLGLNLNLPEPGHESPGWFSDIIAVANFLGTQHSDTGRDFIIGIADDSSGISEDLFDVSSATPDIKQLRAIIGVGKVE